MNSLVVLEQMVMIFILILTGFVLYKGSGGKCLFTGTDYRKYV